MQMDYTVVYSALALLVKDWIYFITYDCIVILFYYYDSIIYGSVAVHVERVDNNNWMVFYIYVYVIVERSLYRSKYT